LADTSDKDEDASKIKYEISVGITGDSVSENYFLTICTPTASAAKEADTGTYVKISSGQGATDWVKNADSATGYDYYRLAEADDTGEKYDLTSSSVISFQINLPSDSPNKLKGQLPTQRKHTDENSAERNKQNENWYILGKFFNQSLTVKTLNGSAVISEEDPVLQAELITTITLDSASATTFAQYAGDIPVYQGFSLQLYQYDSNGKATAVEIPKDAQIKVTYSGVGTTSTKTYSSGDFLQYPLPTDNPALIQKAIVSGTVSLKAKIEIYYPSEAWTEQFPMRTETDDNTSGVEVSAQSRVSFTEDALQTSSMSVTAVDSKSGDTHYYREESKHAVLNYNAVNSITTGDGTDGKDVSHLGVNANDADRNLTMYTQGEYNIMNVVKKEDAKTLCYELQLYCKNKDGTYTENTDNNLLTSLLTSYWKNFSVYRNTTLQSSSITGTISLSDLGDYYDQTEEIIKIPIAFDVLTGSEFEGGDRYYSNYKVVLKMKLQDKDGTILEGSECSDYIIYTNSSIYMEILSGIAGEN
jgi:Pyruvate/2-oxoacid:ferredoxin oxidoreductase delta subunit